MNLFLYNVNISFMDTDDRGRKFRNSDHWLKVVAPSEEMAEQAAKMKFAGKKALMAIAESNDAMPLAAPRVDIIVNVQFL